MKHLLIASLITVLIVFTVTFVVTAINAIGTDFSDIRFSLVISGVAALVASIVVLFWAIPIHLLLSRINQKFLGWYISSAVIPSFAFIYILKPFGRDTDIQLFQQALFCSFAGSLGALGFWYFAVYRQRITSHLNGNT